MDSKLQVVFKFLFELSTHLSLTPQVGHSQNVFCDCGVHLRKTVVCGPRRERERQTQRERRERERSNVDTFSAAKIYVEIGIYLPQKYLH